VATLFPDLSDSEQRALGPQLAQAEEIAVRAQGGRLYDGVGEGLARLAARRPVLLLSNCHRWYLEVFLEQSGFEKLFTDTLCHGDTGLAKDGNLALLRERHGFASPAYAGDTDGDRRACARAGYEFVYAAYGFGVLDAEPAFASFEALCAHLETRIR